MRSEFELQEGYSACVACKNYHPSKFYSPYIPLILEWSTLHQSIAMPLSFTDTMLEYYVSKKKKTPKTKPLLWRAMSNMSIHSICMLVFIFSEWKAQIESLVRNWTQAFKMILLINTTRCFIKVSSVLFCFVFYLASIHISILEQAVMTREKKQSKCILLGEFMDGLFGGCSSGGIERRLMVTVAVAVAATLPLLLPIFLLLTPLIPLFSSVLFLFLSILFLLFFLCSFPSPSPLLCLLSPSSLLTSSCASTTSRETSAL